MCAHACRLRQALLPLGATTSPFTHLPAPHLPPPHRAHACMLAGCPRSLPCPWVPPPSHSCLTLRPLSLCPHCTAPLPFSRPPTSTPQAASSNRHHHSSSNSRGGGKGMSCRDTAAAAWHRRRATVALCSRGRAQGCVLLVRVHVFVCCKFGSMWQCLDSEGVSVVGWCDQLQAVHPR